MKTYLKQYGVRMAIIIVVAALLIGLAARPKADGSSGAVPEAANALRIPIQGAVGSVVEWMRGIYGYIYRYDKLLAENESLRRQLGRPVWHSAFRLTMELFEMSAT